MHCGLRFPATFLAVLLLGSAGLPAFAQSNVVAPPPPPREGTVGPEQLRDFSLGGTNRQDQQAPAEQPPAPAQPPASAGTPPPAQRTPASPAPGAATPATRQPQAAPPGGSPQAPSEAPAATRQGAPSPNVSLGLPPPTPVQPSPFDFNAPGFGSPSSAPAADVAPELVAVDQRGLPLWPWLLALAAVIAAGLFLWSRRRAAGGPSGRQTLAFAGDEPAPTPAAPRPQPAPAPPRAAPSAPEPVAPRSQPAPANPKGVGIVSSRLRPWLDVDVTVAGAVLTDEELQLHLQLLVSNTGSTPARQVGVEVVALNAGPDQEAELAAYFGRPDPEPRAADMIAPLDQVVLQTLVRMPRGSFREYSAGGGRVLVPVVAVTAAYRAGGNTGRTSAAFLIGRATAGSDKLGPLRTDQGPREFRGLIARALPGGFRR